MVESFQSFSPESFPCLQRILTFLANCGLRFYSIKFSWFEQKGWLYYPFTHPYNTNKGLWFDGKDEAIFEQQEHASFNTTLLVAHVLGYRLELDHGRYRLRYPVVSTRRQQLICDLLAERGITNYEIIDEVSEGKMLPPYQDFAGIEDCSGTVVTLTAIYGFWLDYVDGRHTLGDKCIYWHNGKDCYFWEEYTLEDIRPNGKYPGFEREVEEARRRLHLRRLAEIPQSEGTSKMWELREEDANQLVS